MSNAFDGNYGVYKKWRKGGFATFTYWAEGGKVVVDIGDVNTTTNKAISSTKCFIPIDQFMAYLHAEVNDRAHVIYPTILMNGSKHGATWFGGTSQARVFKIEDWAFSDGKDLQPSPIRRFKCGLFEKVPGADGTQPDFSKRISANMIQMKPFEIAALYQSLLAHYHAYITASMTTGSLTTKQTWEKTHDD